MESNLIEEQRESRLRVLIVEDSPIMRKSLTELFAMLPRLEVVGEAKDGVEALEAFHRLQPDVMTLDMQMPKMGGLEVLRRIPRDNCRVIVLTLEADEFYQKKCRELNASHFFDKVGEFDRFVDLLKAL